MNDSTHPPETAKTELPAKENQQSSALPWQADSVFHGGDMDCGNGLLLMIRKHLDTLSAGQFLEITSTESSVEVDLPAWCQLTNNELIAKRILQTAEATPKTTCYLIRKGEKARKLTSSPPKSEISSGISSGTSTGTFTTEELISRNEESRETYSEKSSKRSSSGKIVRSTEYPWSELPLLPVMGIGSWPRPPWLLTALEEYVSNRMPDPVFQALANHAVQEAVRMQTDAGVDIITDGEQRRDSYASFVGLRLQGCQLIPLADLAIYSQHPNEFTQSLKALDVPRDQRHPAVIHQLQRTRSLAVDEYRFARQQTDLPIKIALPGPYLLQRTLWLDCIPNQIYQNRETLADDLVKILREEIADLLAAGVALIQFDEPVLTEVVYGKKSADRSFMCGALAEASSPAEELARAENLLLRVIEGFPPQRLGLHICRGNWSRDESVALTGNYQPLLPLLTKLPFGTLFLELCTPRAGEMAILSDLPSYQKIGIGIVNPKQIRVETVDEIKQKIDRAIATFGIDRILLTPDCGFATFALHPLSSSQIAQQKLANIVRAATQYR